MAKSGLMEQKQGFLAYMPSGRPAPVVLTEAEVIEILRLESKNPHRTLKYYRDEGMLTGIMLGRKVRYTLPEVMRFLAQKEGNGVDSR